MPTSPDPAVTHLLDTSAVLAYVLNEPEASYVAPLYPHMALAFISIAEMYAALWLKFSQSKANEVIATIKEWQRPWLWPTENTVLLAGRFRAVYRLDLADSFIAALASVHNVTLVTKDQDFRTLQPELKLRFL